MKKLSICFLVLSSLLFLACRGRHLETPGPEGNGQTSEKEFVRIKSYSPGDRNDFYSFEYDCQKRLIKLTEFDNDLTIYYFSVLYGSDKVKKIHWITDSLTYTVLFKLDSQGRAIEYITNNKSTFYRYNSEGYLTVRITDTDSTVFEYANGNMVKSVSVSDNGTAIGEYIYTSYVDRAGVMDPVHTGLMQDICGKKSRCLPSSYKTYLAGAESAGHTLVYSYTFDTRGLPVQINGTFSDGRLSFNQINEFK